MHLKDEDETRGIIVRHVGEDLLLGLYQERKKAKRGGLLIFLILSLYRVVVFFTAKPSAQLPVRFNHLRKGRMWRVVHTGFKN